MARSSVTPLDGPSSTGTSSSAPLNGSDVGEIGAGCGAEMAICKSAGPAPVPGEEIEVGMPRGVDTPGRPPKSPPVPGKLMNEPPPEPGACPKSEFDDPGSPGTPESIVGA
jgi:hypothetical protein